MATLYFGGSFNPIHHGHLLCSRAVAEARGFDRVVLIPSRQPPHKPEAADMAPAADRLAMCRIAVEGDPLFDVDPIEISREGPSYTIDTAAILKARDGRPVNWLIGADMLLYLPHWHRPLELLKAVNFVVMARPGWTLDWESLPEPFRVLKSAVAEVPQIDVSSTTMRARVKAGRSILYLTPSAVCEYVRKRMLYRDDATSLLHNGQRTTDH